MKNSLSLIILFSMLMLLNACSDKKPKPMPKPYHYPNYDIIKPKKVCKPKHHNIQKLLSSHFGKPYVWAEEGPDAFDCSGLTYNLYGSMGMDIPRVAREQAKMGKKIPFKQLYYGDLIFFGSPNKKSTRITHVGIYLGGGWFAHANSKDRKVTTSHFEKEPLYARRIKVCRRYMSRDERTKYMYCNTPIKKMDISSLAYTTPWKTGMHLPKKAVPH